MISSLFQLVLRQDNQSGRRKITNEQTRRSFSHQNQWKFTRWFFSIRQVSEGNKKNKKIPFFSSLCNITIWLCNNINGKSHTFFENLIADARTVYSISKSYVTPKASFSSGSLNSAALMNSLIIIVQLRCHARRTSNCVIWCQKRWFF